jgi:TonB family protein
MRSMAWTVPGVLLCGALMQAEPALAQQAPGEGYNWVECTGEAAPPVSARPLPGRLPPIVETSFRRPAVEESFSAEWGEGAHPGCVLLLMRWTGDGDLEPVRVLEAEMEDAVVDRVQALLLESRVLRAPRDTYLRVLAWPGSPLDLEVGPAWEAPPRLANSEEVDDLVAAVQLGAATRRTLSLRVSVAEDGTVSSAEIDRFSGDAFVDQQLLWIADFFDFEPALVEGSPVPGVVQLPFVVTASPER